MHACQFDLLAEAARDEDHLTKATQDYLNLRNLLQTPNTRGEFRSKFAAHYGINAARPSKQWRDRYFEILFDFQTELPADAHVYALRELYEVQSQKGRHKLHLSFVSKLVAIHDETHPIFDQNVKNFFGLCAPEIGSLDFRIAGFMQNLGEIRLRYNAWMEHGRFAATIENLRDTIPGMDDCHHIRICDFLVWWVGAHHSIDRKKKVRRDAAAPL